MDANHNEFPAITGTINGNTDTVTLCTLQMSVYHLAGNNSIILLAKYNY